jgi:hypothetical protein
MFDFWFVCLEKWSLYPDNDCSGFRLLLLALNICVFEKILSLCIDIKNYSYLIINKL